MEAQLSIDIPFKITGINNYGEALAEYTKDIQAGHKDIFFCYNPNPKEKNKFKHFFVSRWFKKDSIESWYGKTITIIK